MDIFEEFYLTCTTFTIDFMIEEDIDNLMKNVILAIQNDHDHFIKKTKVQEYDVKYLLGETLYSWMSKKRRLNKYKYEIFWKNFKEAFSDELYGEFELTDTIRHFKYKVKHKKDKIHVTVFHDRFFFNSNKINGATFKYNKNESILKLSFIELPIEGIRLNSIAIFKEANRIYKDLKATDPNITFEFHKKYQDLYDDALKRGYLDEGIYDGIFKKIGEIK